MTCPAMTWSAHLLDEHATVAFGERVGGLLGDGAIVYLTGTLGAGKTTFCRGVLQAFGYSGAVKSPTYTLVEPYELRGRSIYHFDLYRLGDAEELEFMGVRDYFVEQNICLIEWPDKGHGYIPKPDITAQLKVSEGGRDVTLCAETTRGNNVISSLTC